jgi:hypothetical protein
MKCKCMQTMALLSFLFVFSQTTFAKVWRVNNNAGVSADFTQPGTAIANPAVQNGDTIYLEGSAAFYQGFSVTKKLVFIGTGYFLTENTGLQANSNDSWVSNIIIDSLGSGTSFYGIRTGIIQVNSNVDNLIISRCHLGIAGNSSFTNSKAANWIISKCYLSGFNFTAGFNFENLQIVNCFLNSTFGIASSINGLFRNNLVSAGSFSLVNSYVANNIFLSSGAPVFTNCTVKYNLAQSNILPAGNNNQNNIPAANLFTLTGSTDGRYQLRGGSPAIGAGEPVNGVTPDIGPFGTADPYRLSGIPSIPTIYALTVPSSVPSSATTMTITVSTRSNN